MLAFKLGTVVFRSRFCRHDIGGFGMFLINIVFGLSMVLRESATCRSVNPAYSRVRGSNIIFIFNEDIVMIIYRISLD